MFRAGAFVAEHVTPISDQQVQPNGVDLTVEAILEPQSTGRIGREGKEIADREAVDVVAKGPEDAETYVLEPGGYVAQYGETVSVPEGHVGFVLPRSSLMRNGSTLETAVWDAGYTGKGEGLLEAHHGIEIERGARIAQFVLARASHEDTYDGTYQGERVE